MLSTFTIVVGFVFSEDFEYVWPMDRMLNVVTCFVMLGRNRQWVKTNVLDRLGLFKAATKDTDVSCKGTITMANFSHGSQSQAASNVIEETEQKTMS